MDTQREPTKEKFVLKNGISRNANRLNPLHPD
jgi:hypothetical protein